MEIILAAIVAGVFSLGVAAMQKRTVKKAVGTPNGKGNAIQIGETLIGQVEVLGLALVEHARLDEMRALAIDEKLDRLMAQREAA